MTPPGTILPFNTGATMTRYLSPARTQTDAPDPVCPVILDPRDPMAIARRFVADKFTVDGHPALRRYREEFFKFMGSCYGAVDNDTVRADLWSYLERAIREGTHAPLRPHKGLVDGVFDAVKGVCNLPASVQIPAWLGAAQAPYPAMDFLAVQNGLLHLPSGELHPPSPLYFGLGASDVTYDANAPEPTEWFKFLNDVFGVDTASIQLLQDMLGYGLGSDTSQQKIMLFIGPPRAGKGTIGAVLTALVGHTNVCAPTMVSLSQNFGLSSLIGKSVALIGDARIGGRADQAAIAERLLSISGGDTQTVDRKFKEPWTGRLPTRFFIMSNELPRLADHSGALANRFVVLMLTRSFLGAEDLGLQTRLSQEYPGILNWALKGHRRLSKQGRFVQAESGLEAVRDLVELASPLKTFLAEKCVMEGQVIMDDLYQAYRPWCDDNGHEPGSKNTFARNLMAAVPGLKKSQQRVDGLPRRFYLGISLKSPWDS